MDQLLYILNDRYDNLKENKEIGPEMEDESEVNEMAISKDDLLVHGLCCAQSKRRRSAATATKKKSSNAYDPVVLHKRNKIKYVSPFVLRAEKLAKERSRKFMKSQRKLLARNEWNNDTNTSELFDPSIKKVDLFKIPPKSHDYPHSAGLVEHKNNEIHINKDHPSRVTIKTQGSSPAYVPRSQQSLKNHGPPQYELNESKQENRKNHSNHHTPDIKKTDNIEAKENQENHFENANIFTDNQAKQTNSSEIFNTPVDGFNTSLPAYEPKDIINANQYVTNEGNKKDAGFYLKILREKLYGYVAKKQQKMKNRPKLTDLFEPDQENDLENEAKTQALTAYSHQSPYRKDYYPDQLQLPPVLQQQINVQNEMMTNLSKILSGVGDILQNQQQPRYRRHFTPFYNVNLQPNIHNNNNPHHHNNNNVISTPRFNSPKGVGNKENEQEVREKEIKNKFESPNNTPVKIGTPVSRLGTETPKNVKIQENNEKIVKPAKYQVLDNILAKLQAIEKSEKEIQEILQKDLKSENKKNAFDFENSKFFSSNISLQESTDFNPLATQLPISSSRTGLVGSPKLSHSLLSASGDYTSGIKIREKSENGNFVNPGEVFEINNEGFEEYNDDFEEEDLNPKVILQAPSILHTHDNAVSNWLLQVENVKNSNLKSQNHTENDLKPFSEFSPSIDNNLIIDKTSNKKINNLTTDKIELISESEKGIMSLLGTSKKVSKTNERYLELMKEEEIKRRVKEREIDFLQQFPSLVDRFNDNEEFLLYKKKLDDTRKMKDVPFSCRGVSLAEVTEKVSEQLYDEMLGSVAEELENMFSDCTNKFVEDI